MALYKFTTGLDSIHDPPVCRIYMALLVVFTIIFNGVCTLEFLPSPVTDACRRKKYKTVFVHHPWLWTFWRYLIADSVPSMGRLSPPYLGQLAGVTIGAFVCSETFSNKDCKTLIQFFTEGVSYTRFQPMLNSLAPPAICSFIFARIFRAASCPSVDGIS